MQQMLKAGELRTHVPCVNNYACIHVCQHMCVSTNVYMCDTHACVTYMLHTCIHVCQHMYKSLTCDFMGLCTRGTKMLRYCDFAVK